MTPPKTSATPRSRLAAALALLALAAMLLSVAFTSRARATDATKPAACDGDLLTDPAGDQKLSPLNPLASESQPNNADIKSVFFNYAPGKDGKTVLTANMVIANLDKTVPAVTDSQGGLYWYFIYSYGDAVKFVAAHDSDGSAIAYEYGTIDPTAGTYTTEGTTTGTFFEGADGVVQIDVPEAVGGKPGDKLGKVIATVDSIDVGTDHGNGLNNHIDTTPADADALAPNGRDYTVAPCAAGAGGGGGGGGGTAPIGSPTPTPSSGPSTLPIHFASSLGSAKKASKGKRLVVKATADQPIANLVLTLKKLGGKGAALAAGKAASVKAGATKIKLKVAKKKKLKKGVYTLIATGIVDGKKLTVGQKVALSK